MNRLLGFFHPLGLLAFAAVLVWLAWDWELGPRSEPLPDLSPARATGPSLERAIAAMGQDPAEAVEW